MQGLAQMFARDGACLPSGLHVLGKGPHSRDTCENKAEVTTILQQVASAISTFRTVLACVHGSWSPRLYMYLISARGSCGDRPDG